MISRSFYHIAVLYCFVTYVYASIIVDSDNEEITVETDCGPVDGKRFREKTSETTEEINVFEFRNIPYALAPSGALRWRPPVRLSKNPANCWNGTLKYDERIVACKQIYPRNPNLTTTEDCLVLTVRTPSLFTSEKLPVMVWIHGGGMVWGFNEMFAYHPDTEFSANMQVVTVSINYRLNLFGFLSLKELWIENGENESYGNYGLMDQIEALRWVKDNIGNFGGDPNKVTIYGESGGGTAVYCLMCSPLAKGLFQKASPASGAPHIRTTHTQADKEFRSVLKETGCNLARTREEVVHCLQGTPAQMFFDIYQGLHLLTYHTDFPVNTPYKGQPLEILDPVVVLQSPDSISLDIHHDVQLLIGNCAQEIGPAPAQPSPDKNITTWRELQEFVEPKMDTFQTGLYPHMLEQYLMIHKQPPAKISPRYIYQLMASDVLLICTTNNVAQHLSKVPGTIVTRYIVSQPPTKQIGLGVDTAYHGWDSVALFGLKFFKGKTLPETDKKLMTGIRSLYKNFMHSTDMEKYANKTVDFWNETFSLQTLGQYHKDKCNVWKMFGLLDYSWGNLGLKIND